MRERGTGIKRSKENAKWSGRVQEVGAPNSSLPPYCVLRQGS